LRMRFDKASDHMMPCHEFCGIGHQGMWGRVKVIDKAAFLSLASEHKRLTCVN
jgi:cytochrome c oxidase subunit II